MTLIFAGIVSCVLFLMGTNIPSLPDQREVVYYQNYVLNQTNSSLTYLNTSNNAQAAPNAALAADITQLANSTGNMVKSTSWLNAGDVTSNSDAVNLLRADHTAFQP